MGTRSTVRFYDGQTQLINIYQQYDGYITGVGHDLAKWLKGKKIVNGFGPDDTMENGFANGMGCLAAQYVASLKTRIGYTYITHPDATEGYDYEVRYEYGQFYITLDDVKYTPDELLAVGNEPVDENDLF